METDIKKAEALGFESYISKPIKIPEFFDTINKFLEA